jgi:enoyl-[acyl-carrier protein] reductase I
MLTNKTGVIFGLANHRSIATAVAQSWNAQGAKVIFGVQSARFLPNVDKITESWSYKPLTVICDVQNEESIRSAMSNIRQHTDKVDAMLHSIAYATPQTMKQSILQLSQADFNIAMDTSVYSLLALTRDIAPLMANGGSITTLSYLGAHRVVPQYNIMGPAKAALESLVRYLAVELVSIHTRQVPLNNLFLAAVVHGLELCVPFAGSAAYSRKCRVSRRCGHISSARNTRIHGTTALYV